MSNNFGTEAKERREEERKVLNAINISHITILTTRNQTIEIHGQFTPFPKPIAIEHQLRVGYFIIGLICEHYAV